MKIKQQRRWKRRTAAEQHQIACRVTGWVLWMLLLAGGAGFAAASAAGKYRMPSGSSSSAFAPLQKRADQAAAETLPGHGLFLQAYTAGTLATGGNRVQDVCLTQERLLEMPETLDTAELSKTATLFNDFYQAYEVPMFLGAVPAAGEFYAADLLGSAPFSSQLSELDTFYDEVPRPFEKSTSIRFSPLLRMTTSTTVPMRSGRDTVPIASIAAPSGRWALFPSPTTSTPSPTWERTGAVCTVRATTDGSHRTSSTGTRAAPAAASHL